jgi:mercuric reductase
MSTSTQVDLAVIGSGGAGMAAAITARGAGRRVVVVERGTLGGTCVNIGCIPSKTLLAAAGTRHDALTNPFPGAPTTAGTVDLAVLVAQKDELTAGLRQAKYADVAVAHGFEVLTGQARFRDPYTLEVDGRVLDAAAVLVATGAEPAIPDLPGLGTVDVLTSTTAMEQTSLPESLVVIGGGYVGAEQAQLFAHLGARVTLVGRLAPRAEPELSRRLRGVFEADGITVIEEHASTVEATGAQVTVTTTSGRRVTGERLLVATGRRARTDGLNLAGAGIEVDRAGFIVADAHQRTTNPRVWAAGDVTGAPQYVYVASATGRVAAANALGLDAARVDYAGLPQVMFTRPQLASAGLTEAEATAAGHDCETRVLDLAEVPRALVNRDVRGAIAMVADTRTGTVLGVHALADGAGEIMLAATYAIAAAMTVDDMAGTWAPYLTMAESLRLVAGQFAGQMPVSCCA